jgi:hypothetical protein
MKKFILSLQEISDKQQPEDSAWDTNQQMSDVVYNIPEATFAIDRYGKVIAGTGQSRS